MLKIGGFGIIRFMLPHFIPEVHIELIPYISLALLCGCLYTSLNTLRQIDLKRFIAFGSIMHMTLAIIAVFTLCDTGIKAAIYMMISHGFIAASLFFLIGTLTERYHNRSSLAYSGLLAVMPVFGFYFLLASLANIGFPGTSGFIPEFGAILSILSQVSFTSLLHTMPLVLLSMFIMTASTFTLYLRLFFGSIKINYITSRPLDLTKKDFVIMAILLIPVFILG
jgi:NADH-quinone oxidoreductase subunit M